MDRVRANAPPVVRFQTDPIPARRPPAPAVQPYAVLASGIEISPQQTLTTHGVGYRNAVWTTRNTVDLGPVHEDVPGVRLSGQHTFRNEFLNQMVEVQRRNPGLVLYLGIPPENPQKYVPVARPPGGQRAEHSMSTASSALSIALDARPEQASRSQRYREAVVQRLLQARMPRRAGSDPSPQLTSSLSSSTRRSDTSSPSSGPGNSTSSSGAGGNSTNALQLDLSRQNDPTAQRRQTRRMTLWSSSSSSGQGVSAQQAQTTNVENITPVASFALGAQRRTDSTAFARLLEIGRRQGSQSSATQREESAIARDGASRGIPLLPDFAPSSLQTFRGSSPSISAGNRGDSRSGSPSSTLRSLAARFRNLTATNRFVNRPRSSGSGTQESERTILPGWGRVQRQATVTGAPRLRPRLNAHPDILRQAYGSQELFRVNNTDNVYSEIEEENSRTVAFATLTHRINDSFSGNTPRDRQRSFVTHLNSVWEAHRAVQNARGIQADGGSLRPPISVLEATLRNRLRRLIAQCTQGSHDVLGLRPQGIPRTDAQLDSFSNSNEFALFVRAINEVYQALERGRPGDNTEFRMTSTDSGDTRRNAIWTDEAASSHAGGGTP